MSGTRYPDWNIPNGGAVIDSVLPPLELSAGVLSVDNSTTGSVGVVQINDNYLSTPVHTDATTSYYVSQAIIAALAGSYKPVTNVIAFVNTNTALTGVTTVLNSVGTVITLANGNNVCLSNQTTALQNARYIFNSGNLTLASDCLTGSNQQNTTFFETSTGNQYGLISSTPEIVGTNVLNFTLFSQNQTYFADEVTLHLNTGTNTFSINTGYVGQSSITTLGTISTGIWNGTNIDLSRGGTNATLTANVGGIVYSASSALAILSGTSTASKMLLSGSTAAPTWSTSTIPTSSGATANKVLLSDGTNYVLSTPTFPNSSATLGKIIISDGTNWIASTPTFPNSFALGDMIYSSATNVMTSLSGNITAVKQYLSQTGTGTVSAAPTWATISGSDITGAALTKTDDTNVTLTLGGTPTTSLLRTTSLTLGWTGTLAETRGGTNQSTYALGDMLYASAANTLSKLAGNILTKKFLTQTGTGTVSAAPTWATISTSDLPTAALSASSDTNINITLGGSPTNALINATSITMSWAGLLSPSRGGTGVNNGLFTQTWGGTVSTAGSFTIIGAFTTAFTMTANTVVTFPTSGTLATTSGSVPTVQGTSDEILINGVITPVTGSNAVFTLSSTLVTPGTLSINGITAGSVLFSGASGLVSQDNSNLFWDNTGKRLTIGSGSLTDTNSKLEVHGGFLNTYFNSASVKPQIVSSNAGLSLGWNASGGGAEVNFYNNFSLFSGTSSSIFTFSYYNVTNSSWQNLISIYQQNTNAARIAFSNTNSGMGGGNIYGDTTYDLHLDTQGNGKPIAIDGSFVNVRSKLGVLDANPSASISSTSNAQIGFSSGTSAPANSLAVNTSLLVGTNSVTTNDSFYQMCQFGAIGVDGNISIGMSNSFSRFREVDAANKLAISSNYNLGLNRSDSSSFASWNMYLGNDVWQIQRAPATAGAPAFVNFLTLLSNGNFGLRDSTPSATFSNPGSSQFGFSAGTSAASSTGISVNGPSTFGTNVALINTSVTINPGSQGYALGISGGLTVNGDSIATNTTLTSNNHTVKVDTNGGPVTVTMPATVPGTSTQFWYCLIKDAGNAAGTNNITIDGNGHNIDFASTAAIKRSGGALGIFADGTQFYIW